MTASLAACERALADADDEAALDHLLVAWRRVRAPAIAELIDAIGARLDARLPPITGDTRKQLHETWLRTAQQRRAADLPRLLDSITDTKHRSTDALARVRALARWPHDPRTGAGVIRQLQRPIFYTTSTKPFWTELVALAVEHGDPRTRPALEQLSASYHRILVSKYADLTPMLKWFRRLFEHAIVALGRHPVPQLSTAGAEICQRIASELSERGGSARDLVGEVLAHPDDDHVRQVLADQLQEHGDPRGELIALQLANRDPERQRVLVARHGHTWLGPLARAVYGAGCRFERGFLHEVYLDDDSPEVLARLTGDPIWATVRRLHLGYMAKLPEALLQHPVMRLDHLGGIDGDALHELLGWTAIPYRSLHAATGLRPREHDLALATIERARPALRALRALTLDVNYVQPAVVLERLAGSWLGKQLEHVGISGGLDRLADWLPAIARGSLPIRTFALSAIGEQIGTLLLTRDAEGTFGTATFTVEHALDPKARDWLLAYGDVAAALEHVEPGLLRRIVVVGRPPRAPERGALERACRRIGAKLELPGTGST